MFTNNKSPPRFVPFCIICKSGSALFNSLNSREGIRLPTILRYPKFIDSIIHSIPPRQLRNVHSLARYREIEDGGIRGNSLVSGQVSAQDLPEKWKFEYQIESEWMTAEREFNCVTGMWEDIRCFYIPPTLNYTNSSLICVFANRIHFADWLPGRRRYRISAWEWSIKSGCLEKLNDLGKADK